MTDKKLERDKQYYTCQHQQLAESSCNTCNKGGGGSIDIKKIECSKCEKSLGRILKTSTQHGIETKYEAELDCYQKDDKTHVCAKCHDKQDNNSSRIEQVRSRISELEAITNRTSEQETELQSLRTELANLEKKQSQDPKGKGLGTGVIVGIVAVVLVVVGGVIGLWLWNRNKEE